MLRRSRDLRMRTECGMRMLSAPHGDSLQQLLVSELSAIEAYSRVLAKISGRSAAIDLRRMMQDHLLIARRLEERLLVLGLSLRGGDGESDWVQLAVEAKQNHSEHALLQILVRGEQSGIEDYKDALDDEKVDNTSKLLIQSAALPRYREHLSTLKKHIH